jgi:hypothetical protein
VSSHSFSEVCHSFSSRPKLLYNVRSSLKVNRRFGGTYRIHLQGWRVSQARNQHETVCEQATVNNTAIYVRKIILNFLMLGSSYTEKTEHKDQTGHPCPRSLGRELLLHD